MQSVHKINCFSGKSLRKNVAYLGGRCDEGNLLLSAQMGGRYNQGGGDVTRGRSDGRPVWLEMPRQQRHRYISKTQRKNTELL